MWYLDPHIYGLLDSLEVQGLTLERPGGLLDPIGFSNLKIEAFKQSTAK